MFDPWTADGVKAALKRAQMAEEARRPEDVTFQKLAAIFRPGEAYFTATRSPGDDRFRNVFDGAPQEAAVNLAGGLFGTVMNPANRWFELLPPTAARDDDAARRYMWEATDAVAETLEPAVSSFYVEAPTYLVGLGIYGTGHFYSNWSDAQRRWVDKAHPLHSIWISGSPDGEVRAHYLKREMTVEDLRAEYPDPVDPWPEKIAKAEAKNLDDKCCVWWICMPNPKVEANAGNARSRRFVVLHILDVRNAKGQPVLLRRSGDDTSPFMTGRWERRADSPYGYGRGHVALADAASLQVATKHLLEASAWAARPPILTANEKDLQRERIAPAAIVRGGMSRAGRPMAQAMDSGTRMPFAADMKQQLREVVQDAFFFKILQVVGRSGMSATEVVEYAEQRWRLMGPAIALIQAEFLAPLLRRRWRIMLRLGLLPPNMPDAIRRMFAPPVDFTSPMAMAQRSADGVAALRLSDAVKSVFEIKPGIADNLNEDDLAREFQETFGARPHLLNDRRQVERIRAERARQQQQQQAIEAAPGAASALKSLSDMSAANDDASLAGLGRSAG